MAIKTNAIRAFQQKLHSASISQQKEIRLSIIEAKNLSNELSQITALLLELSQAIQEQPINIEVETNKF